MGHFGRVFASQTSKCDFYETECREVFHCLRGGALSTYCRASNLSRVGHQGLIEPFRFPVSMNQGFEVSGTSSRPSVTIDNSVSRVHSISGNSHGLASQH